MPEDCAPLVVFLASDAAAGITGQAIGIGGDRLTVYSHPAAIAEAYRDGGWDAESIAAEWEANLSEKQQTPPPPPPPVRLDVPAHP